MTRTDSWSGVESAPRWIVLVTAAYLVLGCLVLGLWRMAAPTVTVQASTGGSDAPSVIGMAVAQVWLCLLAWRSFRPGQPLRPAWLLIGFSAALRVACGVLALVGEAWPVNALPGLSGTDGLLKAALVLGGPLQMASLAAGLLVALHVLGRFGLRARFKAAGWTLAAGVMLSVIIRFGGTAAALLSGRTVDSHRLTALAGAPILCLLLFEALVLWRSATRMGTGPIAKCWGAFAAGIFLTGLGEVALWALHAWFPGWPVAAFEWYLAFPAAAAFALAPAYQVAAIRRASGRVDASPASLPARPFPRALPVN